MSESAAAVSINKVPSGNSLKFLQTSIMGKITRVRKHEKFFYTTLICPAKDEYSKPNIVEIRSFNRFGDVDEVSKITVDLGGYEGKSYRVVDKETGESKTLIPVNLFLDLVIE